MRYLIVIVTLFVVAPAAAQVQSRPTDAPLVTAAGESWYQLREPVQFAGDLYYPAGAAIFFNGNTMVRTGHYNGVPLYADTTLEPYSIVYVPISRGLMQPYEKLRRGDLAGTTGSRTPSFPVRAQPDRASLPAAAIAPTDPPQPIGAISVFTPNSGTAVAGPTSMPTAVTPATAAASAIPTPEPMATLMRPESNDGIWIRYVGEKWLSAGKAVPSSESEFVQVGDYVGFPVFARQGLRDDVIYLPTRAGLIAPYRVKR
jgi:hypothetical protein